MQVLLLSTMDNYGMKGTLRCLDQTGHTVVIIGCQEGRGSILMPCCKDYYVVPQSYFSEGIELLELIKLIYNEEKCDVVLPVCVSSITYMSQNKYRLAENIVVADWAPAEVIQKLNNKWNFYNYINEIGVNTPRTILLPSAGQAHEPTIEFPALIKPLELGGGLGIQYFWRRDEYDPSMINDWPVIMQEYLPGYDIDVNIYSRDGIVRASSVQQLCMGGLKFSINKHAVDMCQKIVAACGYTGLAHFDLRYDERDGQLKCLECNPRCWGTMWASARAGINYPDLLLNSDVSGDRVLEIEPQWVPFFKKQVLKNPMYILKNWHAFYRGCHNYAHYFKNNFLYEMFITLMVRSPSLAERWMERVYTGISKPPQTDQGSSSGQIS